MGYVNDMVKTKESVDEDFWLHTGDVGKIDPTHGLLITGRIKVSRVIFFLQCFYCNQFILNATEF